ncbi:MAG: RsmD family RNA methyltransferase [Ruminococcus sp.]|jgi:16S rRNA (guanine(966)-N(2))-methyltransferase RsmD|nr:RsmD family RNA methyltransferase [Ruminococcus sp.]
MRVISGVKKGKNLLTPEDYTIRPTSDKVRGAVFNVLQFEIRDKIILDLFCGTGALGIEALSRGASFALFVDNSPVSLDLARKNVAACGFEEKARFVLSDAVKFLKNTDEKFDITFLDPPYNRGILQKIIPLCTGKIIAEHESDLDLQIGRTYKYGKIGFTVIG